MHIGMGFMQGSEMDSESYLRQKEELYYKLLENYSYEKITTFDTGREKETTIFKCKYEG